MLTSIRFRLLVFFLLLLFSFLLLPQTASADTTYVIVTEDEPQQTDVLVGQLQDRLTALGYYTNGRTLVYDSETQYAVYLFCTHNGLPYPQNGVTEELWNIIHSNNAVSIAENPAVYTDIPFGAQGDSVLALQTRLKELLYYTEDMTLSPGLYDDGTQRALELFCEANNIAYTGSGADAALQQIIFSDGAAPYAPPDGAASEKISTYMLRSVPMLGAAVPMFFIWIVSVVLIVLILVLFIYFFVPGETKPAPPSSAPIGTPRHWKKNLAGRESTSSLSQEMMHGSYAGHTLNFQISYQGKIRNEQILCNPSITIGRGYGNLPLDASDGCISHSHCDLYYKGAVLMLTDHSTNGTCVNGSIIHNCECRINNGDHLVIGSHNINLRF